MGELVYEGVMRTDFSGEPQPLLDKEVTVAGTSSTISLREGMQFHGDYDEVKTADVIASFERYKRTTREADVAAWYKVGSATAEAEYTVSLGVIGHDHDRSRARRADDMNRVQIVFRRL